MSKNKGFVVLNEQVLVVPRQKILPPAGEAFYGVSAGALADIMSAIAAHGFFMDRSLAESDEQFKQIIPYFVFHKDEKLFLMQRAAAANEARLASKLTLGIGGHIRAEDLTKSNAVFEWGLREFCEEVCYHGSLQAELLGFINDDTNAVGRVHLGVVYLVHGDSDDIAIRTELAAGELVEFSACQSQLERMESWSSLVMQRLSERRLQYGTLAFIPACGSAQLTRVQI